MAVGCGVGAKMHGWWTLRAPLQVGRRPERECGVLRGMWGIRKGMLGVGDQGKF